MGAGEIGVEIGADAIDSADEEAAGLADGQHSRDIAREAEREIAVGLGAGQGRIAERLDLRAGIGVDQDALAAAELA